MSQTPPIHSQGNYFILNADCPPPRELPRRQHLPSPSDEVTVHVPDRPLPTNLRRPNTYPATPAKLLRPQHQPSLSDEAAPSPTPTLPLRRSYFVCGIDDPLRESSVVPITNHPL
ncbi:hypothetical protein FA13DRAFT_1804169 [Coprinellus micaceus]|uniref:Uncharacterized protein n=1 Tax=Coprinellus micaceus TaxID=71717 RepID=A0A4Y7S9K0_COPMI|nr:hypothetical protein FA13DRAFT_1804169 [Coprinellus micaceus]